MIAALRAPSSGSICRMRPRAGASSGKRSRWTGWPPRRWCWDKCDKEWAMAEERKEQSVHDVELEDKEEAAREGHGAIFATLKAEDKKKNEIVTGRTTDERGSWREDQAVDRHFHSEKKREEAKKQYLYHDAGLFKRHGYVPWWLQCVAVALIIWSIYYSIAYWTPPP